MPPLKPLAPSLELGINEAAQALPELGACRDAPPEPVRAALPRFLEEPKLPRNRAGVLV